MGFLGLGNNPSPEMQEKMLMAQFAAAFEIFQLTVFGYLKKQYCQRYSETEAGEIAAAVNNELFFTGQDPRSMYLYDAGLVQEELQGLSQYTDLAEVYTHAIRSYYSMLVSGKYMTAEIMLDRFNKCLSFGIYQPQAFPATPSTDVMGLIRKFYQQIVDSDFDEEVASSMRKSFDAAKERNR